jgi:four helix bundle protein
MFNFEKLEAWQKAVDFADLVYTLTRNFPNEERFGLTNQLRRVAVSISSSIAESTSRDWVGGRELYVDTAAGAVFEVVSQSTIALRQGLLDHDSYRKLYSAAEEQSRVLSELRKSLKSE